MDRMDSPHMWRAFHMGLNTEYTVQGGASIEYKPLAWE